MKGRIASGLLVASLALVAGCGGSGTNSSGTFNCNGGSVNLGPGLTCDDTTSPPTIKVNFGTTTGTVASGDDSRFGGGHQFLGVFTPTIAQSPSPTISSPGGLVSGHNGGLIYNAATGRIGVRAANEICASITNWPSHTSAIPSAHACSNEELIANAHAGNIPQGTTGMAFGLVSHNYSSADTNPIDSFKGTCGDWTYDSLDLFQGTTWLVDASDPKTLVAKSFDKAPSIEFFVGKSCGGNSAAGTVVYPIACCD